MKKIISLIICAVLLISALNITIFAETTTSANLLPACISTFESGVGVTSHDHLTYIDGYNHISNIGLSDGALMVNYAGWADPYITPQWHLGYYINQYALSHPAKSYQINVSMKVKGPSKASLAVREFHGYEVSYNEVRIQQDVPLPSDEYTILSGSFGLTSEKALNAHDDWYRLCVDNLDGHKGKNVYFDDITLTIDSIFPLKTKLPESISTFDVVGEMGIDQLTYVQLDHIKNKKIIDGEFCVDYYNWSANFASPMWALGAYISNYATYYEYTGYTVNFSLDLKGDISRATLALRYFGTDSENDYRSFSTSDTINNSGFTTLAGSFDILADDAKIAQKNWYALCIHGIEKSGTEDFSIYFDNIKFEILPKRIDFARLVLGSSLTVDYYADLKGIDPTGVSMSFTFNGQQTTVQCPDEAEKGEKVEGLYKFPFTGINPQCMTDNIKAELVKGDKVIARKDEWSVRDYCVKAYEEDNTNTPLKNLLASLLLYGSAAQNYKGNNIEKLASDGLDWAKNGVFPELDSVLDSVMDISGTPNGSKIKSAGLEFSNVIRLYFRIQADETDVNGLTLKVTRGDGKISEFVSQPPKDKDGYYVYYTDAIYATGFDDKYTVQLLCNSGVVQTVTYSVNSYILRKCNESSLNGKLAKALGYYGYYATQYK